MDNFRDLLIEVDINVGKVKYKNFNIYLYVVKELFRISLNTSIKTFQKWGLEVVLGPNLFKEENQFAGSSEERPSKSPR